MFDTSGSDPRSTTRRRWAASTALLWALGSACAADDGPERSDRQLAGDTTVVVNRAPIVGDTLTATAVSTYGRADGPLEYILNEVRSFAVGPDGDVFVHDLGGDIRQFDRDGTFVRTVAPQGQGPGEVQSVIAMDMAHDARLAVLDIGNGRISVFDADLNVVSMRRPSERPRYGDGSLGFHTDGSLWIGIYPALPATGGLPHPSAAFVRGSMDDGEPTDTVFTPPNAAEVCTTLAEGRFRVGFWEDRRSPFVPKSTWALGRDGSFAIGCPTQYSLTVVRPEGDILRLVRDPWVPVGLTDEQRRDLTLQAQIRVPDRLPAFVRILLTADDRIWVWPSQPPYLDRLDPEMAQLAGQPALWRIARTGAFDVFTGTGAWLATVRLPPDARYSGLPTEPDAVIRGDTIWAVSQDALGIELIVRYEVAGLSPPGASAGAARE